MSKTVSRHELILPLVDDKFILFNGLYGAIDVIDARTADIIRDAQQSDSVPTDLDEDVHERLLRRGQEWLERIMSFEQIDAVFEQMREYRERGRQLLSCTIHGGEPFLARNIKTIRRICEHCRELDLPIGVFTNGYELDAYFDLIKEFDIEAPLITLDGVGAKHDRRRPVVGGGSSYERIVKNVTAALERGIHIRLRTNVDRQNIDDLGELIDEFKARGFIDSPNCSYYFLRSYNRNGSLTKPFCDTFKEIFNQLLPYACREAWLKERSTELSASWREPLSKFDEEDRRTLLKTTDPKQTLDIWSKAGDLNKMLVIKNEMWID